MAVNNYAPAEYGGYVQGVESGGGGSSSSGMVVFEYPLLSKSYNELLSMLTAGEIPRFISHYEDNPEIIDDLFILTRLMYDGTTYYYAHFNNMVDINNVTTMIFVADSPDANMYWD